MSLKKIIHTVSQRHVDQVLLCLMPIVLFLDLVIFYKYLHGVHIGVRHLILPVVLNLYLLYISRTYMKIHHNLLEPTNVIGLIPAAFYLMIMIQFVDVIPKWDGSYYYTALLASISNFDLSLKSFLINFNWFGHLTMGYSFATAFSQLISPTNLFMLNLNNFLFGSLGVYCFYSVCAFLFGKKNYLENLIATTIFALNPLYLGISIAYGPDLAVVVFLLAFLASFLANKPLLTAMTGLGLVFSKEIGTLSYIIFVTSYLVLVEMRNWLRYKKVSRKRISSLLAPLIVLLVYMIWVKFRIWNPDGGGVFTWGDDCRFCFGIKQYNILMNMSVIYILNFQWIITIFLILAFVKSKVLPHTTISHSQDVIRILKYVLMGFTLFFMVFIIYITPRYMSLGVPLITILFYSALKEIFVSRKTRVLVLLTISVLFLFQSFITFDPLSKYIFGSYKFGNHQLLKIGTEYLGDGSIYNTQFVYVQRLVDKFIATHKITEESSIFIDPYAWGIFHIGWGHFTKALPNIYYKISDIDNLPDNTYYVTFPLMEYSELDLVKIQRSFTPPIIPTEAVLAQMKKNYVLSPEERLEMDGYAVSIYKIKKR